MRLLLCVTILAAAGCASWSARRAVLRGNQAIYDGIRTHDEATLTQILAPDLRYHTADGKTIGRDEWMAAMKATPGEIVSISGMHLRTEERGDRVTLCGVQRAVVRLEGKELIDDGAYCNDWQKRDGRWQVVEGYQTTR
jgi:uncharacterized protein DUF4440